MKKMKNSEDLWRMIAISAIILLAIMVTDKIFNFSHTNETCSPVISTEAPVKGEDQPKEKTDDLQQRDIIKDGE